MIGEIFQIEGGVERKVRVCVGLVVGSGLYMIKKFGAIDAQGNEWRLELLAADWWKKTPRQGVEEVPVFGWQLGEPFEVGEDGEVLGDWPRLGYLIFPYEDVFLMHGGALPDDRQHLHLLTLGAVAVHRFRLLSGSGD